MAECETGAHYLTTEQLEYFRERLLKWKMDLLRESEEALEMLAKNDTDTDTMDSACRFAAQAYELRTKDRARKLIYKIDAALERIDDGTYGYCEETGQPIGLKRLEARPVATLCIEEQAKREKFEKSHQRSACDEWE